MSKTLKSNNFFNITPIDIKLLPFDSSQRDDSNKLNFITVGSLDAKISSFEFLNLKIIKFTQNLCKVTHPAARLRSVT